ncbi:MAG: hypothetical protein JJE34_07045 [Alphaproteobacteria bacterium]|nr:hypothetical protein [Alphaproteobacteria bacterium]
MQQAPAYLTYFSVVIAMLALSVSALTLWLTHMKKGKVKLTRPAVVYFGPDGSREEGLKGSAPKIFLRGLLISDSKRGRIVESLYATLQHNESKQNFNVWVYGDDRLVRGSGLFVGDTGIVVNHHFLLPKNGSGFEFQAGKYHLEIHASILGNKKTGLLFSNSFDISSAEASTITSGMGGLYFDWGPQSNRYISHLDHPTNRTSVPQDTKQSLPLNPVA